MVYQQNKLELVVHVLNGFLNGLNWNLVILECIFKIPKNYKYM